MSIVKINAITVPADSGDELARRFAARAGAVDGQDGFEGFELLQPTDERQVWLVVTRWRDEESFQAWLESDAFAAGHAGASARHGGGAASHGGHHGHGSAEAGGGSGHRPVGVSSELWSYQVSVVGGSEAT